MIKKQIRKQVSSTKSHLLFLISLLHSYHLLHNMVIVLTLVWGFHLEILITLFHRLPLFHLLLQISLLFSIFKIKIHLSLTLDLHIPLNGAQRKQEEEWQGGNLKLRDNFGEEGDDFIEANGLRWQGWMMVLAYWVVEGWCWILSLALEALLQVYLQLSSCWEDVVLCQLLSLAYLGVVFQDLPLLSSYQEVLGCGLSLELHFFFLFAMGSFAYAIFSFVILFWGSYYHDLLFSLPIFLSFISFMDTTSQC